MFPRGRERGVVVAAAFAWALFALAVLPVYTSTVVNEETSTRGRSVQGHLAAHTSVHRRQDHFPLPTVYVLERRRAVTGSSRSLGLNQGSMKFLASTGLEWIKGKLQQQSRQAY